MALNLDLYMRLTGEVAELLITEADRRNVEPGDLVLELLEIILRDDLVPAVLD